MDTLIRQLTAYLHEVLGIETSVRPWAQAARLPFYLQDQYTFYSATLCERPCVFMVARENSDTPAQIRKHWQTVTTHADAHVIYVVEEILSYNRKRLIEQKVPFVVPGKQLYLPFLAIDLREQFKVSAPTRRRFLSPAAQVVLLRAIYRRDVEGSSAKVLAQRLGYSGMTMTRAVNELADFRFAELEWNGREKCLRIEKTPRELWQLALPHLQNPVKKTTWIKPDNFEGPAQIAGESALAEYTNIAEPVIRTVALAASAWTAIKNQFHIEEVPQAERDCLRVQLWHYGPEIISTGPCVDKLSLWLSLQNIDDIRVEMALAEMMESLEW